MVRTRPGAGRRGGRHGAQAPASAGDRPPFDRALARRKRLTPPLDRPNLRGAVTLEGWIFMVGLRVFDVGALVVWLVWFFRLRDDEDDDGDDFRGGGEDAPEPDPTGPGGLELPLPDAAPWPRRRRDHAGDLSPAGVPVRRVPARPARAPQRRSGRP